MSYEGTRIVVNGAGKWDGEYEIDTERAFNSREWNWVKRISGYMPRTISDGFAGHDPELFVALAVIGMCRNGKIAREAAMDVADELMEVPFEVTTIQLIGPVEDDASPPVLTSEPDASSQNGSLTNKHSETPKQQPSGTLSIASSDKQDATLSATGTGESGTLPTLVRTGQAS